MTHTFDEQPENQITPNLFEQQQFATRQAQITPRPFEDQPTTPQSFALPAPPTPRFFAQELVAVQETQRMTAVSQPLSAEPVHTARKRRRKWVYMLSLLLILLLAVGALPVQGYMRNWLTPPAKATPLLQHLLHPETSEMQSPDAQDTASLFMNAMMQKNWPVLWSMLDPDAQKLWQGEQEFTHFEQAKFGKINLQGYTLGKSMMNKPWLDPDTTQVYSQAATVPVSMQASAPVGWLTSPSNQALKQGLFQQTSFALIQDRQKHWKVMLAGPADLDAPVLVPANAPATHSLVPIFMYHHISSQPTHNLLDYSLTVTVPDFNAQLDWLQQQGYHAITMTELADNFYYGKALPSKPMILSFDDGYADVYNYALPALLAHHERGVFYIITGMIGGRYMTWDEVRALARSGMQMEDHTVHHPDLGILSPGLIQNELQVSKSTLESELNMPIQFFCYPTGEPFHHASIALRKLVVTDLFQDGYLGATLDPAAFNSTIQNSYVPYQMPRVRVSGGETLSEFEGILSTTLANDHYRLLHLNPTRYVQAA